MKRKNEQTLKEAIDEMIRVYGMDKKLSETRLLDSWDTIMGKTISKHTTKKYISQEKLFIHLNSSVLRKELSYAKENIVKMMNDSVGKKVIQEVVLM